MRAIITTHGDPSVGIPGAYIEIKGLPDYTGEGNEFELQQIRLSLSACFLDIVDDGSMLIEFEQEHPSEIGAPSQMERVERLAAAMLVGLYGYKGAERRLLWARSWLKDGPTNLLARD